MTKEDPYGVLKQTEMEKIISLGNLRNVELILW